MRANRRVSVVLSTIVLAALSGCGGDGDTTPVADDTGSPSVSAAETSPDEASSESAEPVDDGAEQPGGYDAKELLAAMKAAVAEHESAHVVMEIAGDGESMTGEGDVSYAGDTTAMQMTMQAAALGQGTIEVRMVDDMVYLSVPPMTPEGKFIELDADDPNSPFGDLGGIGQGDPLASFDAFDAGLEKVRYLGPEDVDGEQMDHYVLTVDAEKAAKANGTPMGPLPETLTYDLWLDADDLMRRMQSDMPGGGLTLTMSDWGEPVTVTAPPRGALMQMPGMPAA
jgi:hypothetical protein